MLLLRCSLLRDCILELFIYGAILHFVIYLESTTCLCLQYIILALFVLVPPEC